MKRPKDLYRRVRRLRERLWARGSRARWSDPRMVAIRRAVGRSLAAGIALIALSVPARAQDPPAVETALYAGTLMSLAQDGGGALHRGLDLATLRLVISTPTAGGLRLAARGDLTALGALDPASLDLSSVRTAEGYGALSWSRKVSGIEVGPAAMAGALVGLETAVTWRYQSTYGAGVRLGRERSWVYVLAGRDGASDVACCHRCCTFDDSPLTRVIVAGSLEWGRVALVGDFCSGQGGRVRLGALVRVPMIGGGQ